MSPRPLSRSKTINVKENWDREVESNDLLFGSDKLSVETNKEIFSAVHDFIFASGHM